MNFSALYPDALLFILLGLKITMFVAISSLILGLPLGVLLAVAKTSRYKIFSWPASFYVSVFRGTPVLVQLTIAFYAVPVLIGYKLSAIEAGIVALGLNSAAYSAEIIRSGIQSLDIGQWEAAKVLGLSKWQTFLGIILPQAVRNILPALVNEVVNLLKETTAVSVIGGLEILDRARKVMFEKFLFFEPLLLAAAIYYIVVLIISSFASILEKKLRYVRN